MEPFPLPLFELLENAEPWLAVFESVNLYDAELGAVRIDLEPSQSVEIDLYLPGAFAVAVPVERRAQEYCITVRCTGVSAATPRTSVDRISEEIPVNWNNRIRQTHRWLSIAFTVTVIANFVAMAQGEPSVWVTYSPLLPLALLLFTGLYLFVLPYATSGAAGDAPTERAAGRTTKGRVNHTRMVKVDRDEDGAHPRGVGCAGTSGDRHLHVAARLVFSSSLGVRHLAP